MISTTYAVQGMTTPADARAVKDHLSDAAGVGAVVTEMFPAGNSLITLKHKDDVELDRAEIEAKVRKAGDYTLLNGPTT